MRVLVACEFSGRVRDAFARRGHFAVSCDLLPTESIGRHYQGDVLGILHEKWDLVIAFPPCTHLAVSGARYFEEKRKDGRQQAAIDFFMALAEADIPRIAIENPVGIMSSVWRKPDQIIQPWMFGHPESKKTCLWLKGLKPLEPTEIIPPEGWKLVRSAADCEICPMCEEPYCQECDCHYADCSCVGPTMDEASYKEISGHLFGTLEDPAPRPLWKNQTPSGQNKLGPSPDRAKIRSITYEGVAAAMANQWGD